MAVTVFLDSATETSHSIRSPGPISTIPFTSTITMGTVSADRTDDHGEEVWPHTPDGVQTVWTWNADKVRQDGHLLLAECTRDSHRIYRKDYLHGNDGRAATTKSKSLWTDKEFSNDSGRQSVKELFGQAIMDFPKSPHLMARLVKMGSRRDSIVLDFFSGSAATAHAVMAVNAEDGGSRRSFMVQLPEQVGTESTAAKAGLTNIAEIGKERMRRAGDRILDGDCHADWSQDVGFRVLTVDTSNMSDVYYLPDKLEQADLLGAADSIKPGRGDPEDLLFQVLVGCGVDLTLSIRRETIIGKTVFLVGEDLCELAACFDDDIDEDLVRALVAVAEPVRTVFRDAAYTSDAAKINAGQIFRQLSPGTDFRSI